MPSMLSPPSIFVNTDECYRKPSAKQISSFSWFVTRKLCEGHTILYYATLSRNIGKCILNTRTKIAASLILVKRNTDLTTEYNKYNENFSKKNSNSILKEIAVDSTSRTLSIQLAQTHLKYGSKYEMELQVLTHFVVQIVA